MVVSNAQAKEWQGSARQMIDNDEGHALAGLMFDLLLQSDSFRRHQNYDSANGIEIARQIVKERSMRAAEGYTPVYSPANTKPSDARSYRNYKPEAAKEGQPAPKEVFAINAVRDNTPQEYVDMTQRSRRTSEINSRLPVHIRQKVIERVWEKLQEEKEFMKLLLSVEVGKSLNSANDEFIKAQECVDYVTSKEVQEQFMPIYSWVDKAKQNHFTRNPNKIPSDAVNVRISNTKKPLGVVGVITSYNYPLALSLMAIFEGMITGNAVQQKLSSSCPNWGFFFQDMVRESYAEIMGAEIESDWVKDYIKLYGKELGFTDAAHAKREILEAGDDLFQIVTGYNTNIVTETDILYFVGSTDKGNEFKAERDKLGKRTLTDLGGNSPVCVMASYVMDENGHVKDDMLKDVLNKIYLGNTSNSGQRCTKAAQLYLDELIAKDVIDGLKDKYKNASGIGNPLDPQNSSGALVDEHAYKQMLSIIETAKGIVGEENVIWKPSSNQFPNGGIYVNPAVIDWTNINDADRRAMEDLISKETFAPLLHIVQNVKTAKEAGEIASGFDHEKLGASIFTWEESERAEFELAVNGGKIEDVNTMVYVNVNEAPKDQAPFGKKGNGGCARRSGNAEGILEYVEADEARNTNGIPLAFDNSRNGPNNIAKAKLTYGSANQQSAALAA